ncbi:MAG: FAD-binding oxidoreductase [Alphaproteobacteria bacterium]|nr:FAD-binding oxidoreductase [Alphaproteobacteria bacterium]
MQWQSTILSTWGRLYRVPTRAARPVDPGEAARAIHANDAVGPAGLVVHGGGRCYADESLNTGGGALLTGGLARILDFDPAGAVATVEGGVTFAALSAHFHGRGFTYPVSAATAAVTIGGAVANDIHSKNHHSVGGFGRHVRWLDLMPASGEVVRCSRDVEPELFVATLGGMGLTGLVVRVGLAMTPVAANAVVARYRRIADLDAFLAEVDAARTKAPFWFGWVDPLASGRNLGRGILEEGRFADDVGGVLPSPAPRRVPVDLPRILLRPEIIGRYNRRRYERLPAGGVEVKKSLDAFYFPLDHIAGFNRVYGRPGFWSVHAGIPVGEERGIEKFLAEIVAARAGSIASVMKPMGGPSDGMLSFPMHGTAFACDLPRRPGVEALHARLERIVLDHGGRLYVAKDGLMSGAAYARMFPRLDEFRAVLARVDPHGRFGSDMSRRLAIRAPLARRAA